MEKKKKEGAFAIASSFVVLISALLSPLTSAIIAIFTMAGYGIWKLLKR